MVGHAYVMTFKTDDARRAQAERMRRYWASRTTEERAEHGRRSREGMLAATTQEERREIMRHARLCDLAHTSAEERRERAQRAMQTTYGRIADEIDPDHALPDDERLKRAQWEHKARLSAARLRALQKRKKPQS